MASPFSNSTSRPALIATVNRLLTGWSLVILGPTSGLGDYEYQIQAQKGDPEMQLTF
jgi:hypothetical protein